MYAIGEHNFVIDMKAWKKICLSEEFTQWAKENGIRNPFEVKTKIFQARIKNMNLSSGFSLREMTEEEIKEMPTQEEIDNYIAMRKEYVKQRLTEEEIEGCSMDLLAADSNAKFEKELSKEELVHYVLIKLGDIGVDLDEFIHQLTIRSKLCAYKDFFKKKEEKEEEEKLKNEE